MKKNTLVLFFYLIVFNVFSQNQVKIDSLLQVLETNIPEKEKVDTYNIIAQQYAFTDSSQTVRYANKAIQLAEKTNYQEGIVDAYFQISWVTTQKGNYKESSKILKEILKTAQKIKYDKGVSLAYKGFAFINSDQGNPDKALEYYFASIKIDKKIGEKLSVAKNYSNVGDTYQEQGDLGKALKYQLKSLKIYKELGHSPNNIYNSIGVIYLRKGNYSLALEYYFKSLKIAEELNDKNNIIFAFNNIGLVYHEQDLFNKALEYYFKSLKIAEELKALYFIANIQNNIGIAYKEQTNYTKALEYYLSSLKIREDLGDKRGLGSIYTNIGTLYSTKKEFIKALKYLQKGLLLGQKTGDQSLVISAMNSIGEIHWKTGNNIQANEYLTKSIQLAQETDHLAEVRDGSLILSKVQKALGNHKAALASYELYHATYDSLLGKEKSKQISQLQIQYETEKKEQEIKSLAQQASIQSLELKQANFNKTIFGVISVILLLVGLVLYLVNRQKRLALKQRAQDIEQNLLRVQMNPHFIFNAMTSIQDYMNQGDAKKASLYLVKFSKLIRQVLDNSRSEFISLDQEINMLDNYLSIQNLKRDHPFTFKIEVEDGLISEEIAIPPMFAQPFVENAIEHGVTSLKKGATIHIYFSMEGDHLVLKILDNGSGIEEAIKIKRKDHVSHAIKITEERIDLYRKMRKKKIAFDIQDLSQGTQVTFNLPFQYI
ncbi:tetratricopeptide repeat-containing sensor histidine kinase [Aquimarina macrocephali]|uniref:tetratricopeptide repeat-containing sensor histidine kinase n=1 Tax=Aquimarina macrocephali TaxID=666563 RepID=UPI003F66BBDD